MPRHTATLRRLGCATLLGMAAVPAQATTWLCGLSPDLVRLHCVADAAPDAPADPTSRAVTTAIVRGTRFPLDPGRAWTVDLWSPPSDGAWLGLLARSTLCYRSPGCEVVLALPPDLRTDRTAASAPH